MSKLYPYLYPELVGYKNRGEACPPPPLPDHCPCCGSRLRFPIRRDRLDRAVYTCGGEYALKDQIQNHTDYWWGSCPRARLAHIVGLDPTVPDKMLDDALRDAGRESDIPSPKDRPKLDTGTGEVQRVPRKRPKVSR